MQLCTVTLAAVSHPDGYTVKRKQWKAGLEAKLLLIGVKLSR
jgi:hypothetical protein